MLCRCDERDLSTFSFFLATFESDDDKAGKNPVGAMQTKLREREALDVCMVKRGREGEETRKKEYILLFWLKDPQRRNGETMEDDSGEGWKRGEGRRLETGLKVLEIDRSLGHTARGEGNTGSVLHRRAAGLRNERARKEESVQRRGRDEWERTNGKEVGEHVNRVEGSTRRLGVELNAPDALARSLGRLDTLDLHVSSRVSAAFRVRKEGRKDVRKRRWR